MIELNQVARVEHVARQRRIRGKQALQRWTDPFQQAGGGDAQIERDVAVGEVAPFILGNDDVFAAGVGRPIDRD